MPILPLGRQHRLQLVQFHLPSHALAGGPFRVVHGVEGQAHQGGVTRSRKVHRRAGVTGRVAGDDIDKVAVGQPGRACCRGV